VDTITWITSASIGNESWIQQTATRCEKKQGSFG